MQEFLHKFKKNLELGFDYENPERQAYHQKLCLRIVLPVVALIWLLSLIMQDPVEACFQDLKAEAPFFIDDQSLRILCKAK